MRVYSKYAIEQNAKVLTSATQEIYVRYRVGQTGVSRDGGLLWSAPVQLIGDEERNELRSAPISNGRSGGFVAHVNPAITRRADSEEDLEQPISRSPSANR